MISAFRPSYLEIDLDRLEHNISNIKSYLAGQAQLMGVLKADAYGTGAVEIARFLGDRLDLIGVATLVEALELRQAGIEKDILILGYIELNHIEELVRQDIVQTIYSYGDAEKISQEAVRQKKLARVHIKINTGMNRLGLDPGPEALEVIRKIRGLENLEVQGIFSHFLDAENRDKSICHRQFKVFRDFLDLLAGQSMSFQYEHICNSAGLMDLEDYYLDLVRAGIILYGIYPENVRRELVDLEFIASLKSRISDIREIGPGDYVGYSRGFRADRPMKLAVIGLGYADGYSEEIRAKIKPRIGDQEISVVGNICMDQTILDVTNIEGLKRGDLVTLFDSRDRDDFDIAWLSQISRRVPRNYIQKNKLLKSRSYLLD